MVSASDSRIFFTITGPDMTLPSAVMWGKRSNCWNTMPMRARKRARSRPLGIVWPAPKSMVRSPTRSVPAEGVSSRLMQRRKVDLPQPEGPITTTTWPRWTSSDTPRTASTVP